MGGKDNKNKRTEMVVSLVMVAMLTVVDFVPLFSYATDLPNIQVMEEAGLLEGTVAEDEISVETTDKINEVTSPEEDEPIEIGRGEEIPDETDGNQEPLSEELVGNPITETTKVMTQSRMAIMATSGNYEMATDADFSGTTSGSFRYIGTKDYVEIPHTIKGVKVTSYYAMFSGTSVKGVKSTNTGVISMASMFSDLKTPTLDVSQLDTAGVTDFNSMFYVPTTLNYAGNLKTLTGLGNFNTTNGVQMSSMFLNSQVTELDLSNFNTEKVTSMASMFSQSRAIKIDVSTFNTSRVTSFGSMFYNAGAYDIIGEEGFDTTKATDMYEMFYGTNAKHLDVSNFNTSKITNMNRMFFATSSTELDVSSFDTSNVVSMSNMFQNAQATTIKGLENFNTARVTNMIAMFSESRATRLDLSSFNTTKVTNMVSMFDGSQATYLDVSSFDTSKVTNMGRMFRGSRATALDLSNFNTSRVTDMGLMFQSNKAQSLDLSSFDTQRVTNMEEMFNASQAKTINMSNFDTTYVTGMKNMFRNSEVTELDLSSFDTRSANKTGGMFYGTKATKGVSKSLADATKLNNTLEKPSSLVFAPKYEMATEDEFIGTVNGSFKYIGTKEFVEVPHTIRGVTVTSYKEMFANTKVKGVISTNKKITDMSGMFKGNTSIELNVSTIDTENVRNMYEMFQDTSTTEIDLRNFVTVNVTNMGSMFKNTKANELDLGSFDLTKVTNTTSMFQSSKATKGYTRTPGDLDKINQSTNKPSSLNFTVWGITVNQTPLGWTNGDVNLEVDSSSGGTAIKETELVNNPGENILGKSIFNKESINAYTGSKVTKISNVSVPEWGVDDALRVKTVRGTGDFQFYWGVSDTSAWLGQQGTYSVSVKNEGKYPITYSHNGLGAPSIVLQPGFSGRIVGTGNFRTSHSFIQFHVQSVGDIDATFWGHKLELGDTVTPWSPAIDTSTSEQGVYPVYSNGTYILRSTDANGETRTVAHTVSNIDRVKPSAELTKSTEGWTSQDVTVYANAKDTLSGVKRITLPDGKVINSDKAEFIAKENKDYTFKVEDNAGNSETFTTTVSNIDRSITTLTTTVDNLNWTKDPINIKVTSGDSYVGLTGISMISSPTKGRNLILRSDELVHSTGYLVGDYTMGSSYKEGLEYTATVNGAINKGQVFGVWFNDSSSYQGSALKIKDRMHSVTFVARPYPHENGTIYGDTAQNANKFRVYNFRESGAEYAEVDNVKLELGNTLTPWTPAPEDIKLINNSKTYPVVANGLYTFEATYNNGTSNEVSVNVTNIDLEAPTIAVKGNPTEYTEDDVVTLEVTASDNNLSGVKSITLPDGKVVTSSQATYKATENGDYNFILEDNVGNKKTHTVKVNKLMKHYFFYIFDGNGKPLKGVGYDLLRDGNVHATAESDATGLVDFGKVPSDGVYTLKQVKAPDGFIIDPSEKDVEVGDETEPEEFVSYPRGKELPATGTFDSVFYATVVGVLASMVVYIKKKLKVEKNTSK